MGTCRQKRRRLSISLGFAQGGYPMSSRPSLLDKSSLFDKVDVSRMPRQELYALVCNWLWESPSQYTPTKDEALKLLRGIQRRKDVDRCANVLDLCRDFLDFPEEIAPPARKRAAL